MPSPDDTRAALDLAAAIGRMANEERHATLRLLVGAVADAVAEHHQTPEVIGCMDDLMRFSRLTADRVLRRSGLDKHEPRKRGHVIQIIDSGIPWNPRTAGE